MISSDYGRTKEYRDELQRTLRLAQQRLSVSDFEGFARGVRREIARCDSELSKYRAVLFPRASFCSWASLLIPGILQIGNKSSSIRFNSPSDANWTAQSQQLRYLLPTNSVESAYAAGGS